MVSPAVLRSISTRARIEPGNHVLIGGFIIKGTAPKTVIARGMGPTLARFGVVDTLSNPVLQLFSGQTPIAQNDDWEQSPNAAGIIAAGLQPLDSREAAIMMTLAPGAYTVIETPLSAELGVGLVEVYDVDSNSPSELTSISTRSVVLSGDNVMIGGISVAGSQAGEFVVRAIGPSLEQFGIADYLPNPTLEIHDSNGTLIAFNDDWQSDIAAPQVVTSGLAPNSPFEAVILRTLLPGAYTAIVRSVSPNVTGVALVEIYRQ